MRRFFFDYPPGINAVWYVLVIYLNMDDREKKWLEED